LISSAQSANIFFFCEDLRKKRAGKKITRTSRTVSDRLDALHRT